MEQLTFSNTSSPWTDVIPRRRSPLGASRLAADVCVVGAGIAGLSVGYALALEGKRVVVLEHDVVGGGEHAAPAAQLFVHPDVGLSALARRLGDRAAALTVASHAAAIDWVEATVAREQIDCGFRRVDGYLFRGASASNGIEEELRVFAQTGLEVELVSRAPFSAVDTGPAIRLPGQAQLHPVAWTEGLADAIERRGGVVASPHRVTRVVPSGNEIVVGCDDGVEIVASACVVATRLPLPGVVDRPLDLEVHRTHAVAVVVQDGTLPSAIYRDTSDPRYAVRVIEGPDGSPTDRIVVSGEDRWLAENDGGPGPRWDALEAFARSVLGGFLAVAHRWTRRVVRTADGLALLGPANHDADRVFVIAGDAGQASTYAAMGATIVRDALAGRTNRFAALYDPCRPSASRSLAPAPSDSGTHARATLPSATDDVDEAV